VRFAFGFKARGFQSMFLWRFTNSVSWMPLHCCALVRRMTNTSLSAGVPRLAPKAFSGFSVCFIAQVGQSLGTA
jgi:hypothetical protein